MKYSSYEGVISWSGGTMVLRSGQSIDEDHPLYAERPELFRGSAPDNPAELQTNRPPGTVESTMQTPGGNRLARAPRGGQPKTPEGGSGQ